MNWDDRKWDKVINDHLERLSDEIQKEMKETTLMHPPARNVSKDTDNVIMCNTDGKMRMADMDNEDAWLVLEFQG